MPMRRGAMNVDASAASAQPSQRTNHSRGAPIHGQCAAPSGQVKAAPFTRSSKPEAATIARRISVTLTPQQYSRVSSLARAHDRSLGWVVREAIKIGLQNGQLQLELPFAASIDQDV